MDQLMSGAITMGFAVAALFFLRFWRDTGDRFFAFFALAFAIFAANRLALTILDDESEARTIVYLARAAAFGLIVAAIVDKNRAIAR